MAHFALFKAKFCLVRLLKTNNRFFIGYWIYYGVEFLFGPLFLPIPASMITVLAWALDWVFDSLSCKTVIGTKYKFTQNKKSIWIASNHYEPYCANYYPFILLPSFIF